MTTRVIACDPATDPRWDAFVQDHPKGQVWHSSAWIEVLRRTYRYEPCHLACVQDGEVAGVLPLFQVTSPISGRRLVSLPFSGPAGPLGHSGEVVEALVGRAIDLTRERRATYVNLQCRDDVQELDRTALSAVQAFVCSLLPLTATNQPPLNVPTRSTRQAIARGLRLGVKVRISTEWRDLSAFYRLYIATGRHHGMPPQPFALFRHIWEQFAPHGAYQMVIAHLAGRPLYAMLCLTYRDVVTGVYAGTDYGFLRWHPVRVGDWAMAEWGRERGFRILDLVQSHVNNPGLRWYKRSLGAVEIPVTHYYYPAVGTTNTLRDFLVGGSSWPARAIKGVVRHLPEPALVALGGAIFPMVG
jgi:hypothetical protein